MHDSKTKRYLGKNTVTLITSFQVASVRRRLVEGYEVKDSPNSASGQHDEIPLRKASSKYKQTDEIAILRV